MEENYKIDEVFKKAFNDFQEEEPSRLTWAALSENIVYKRWLGINFSKFSYRVAIWSITTITILSIGLFTYFTTNKKNQIQNIVSENTNSLNKSNKNPSTEIQPLNKSNSSESLNNNEVINSDNHQNDDIDKKSNIISQKETNIQNSQAIHNNKKEISIITSNTKQKKNVNSISDVKKDNLNSEESDETKYTEIQTDIEKPILVKNEKIVNNSTNSILKTDTAKLVIESKTKINLKQENNVIAKNKKKKNSSDSVGVISAKQLPNQSSKKSDFKNVSLSLYGGCSYVDKTFDTKNEHYNAFRLHNEAPITSIALGAEVSYRFKRLFIQSGFNYAQFGENVNFEIFNVTETKSIKIPVIVPIDTFIDNHYYVIGWDTTGWNDFQDTTLVLTNYIKNNRFDYIEIPLLFGYQFGKKRILLEIAAGPSFGFLVNARGVILNTKENNVYEIISKNDYPMNKNIFNFVFRLKLAYRLNEDWDIFIQPNIKYNLNSVFSKDFPVIQKYNSSGINLGVSIDL
jgi:hypothetical protein